MSAASNYLENELLDHVLRGAAGAWTAPTTLYIALFKNVSSVSPEASLEANSGAYTYEITGTNYARQTITFDAAASGATSNTATITFPVAGSNWGTVTHVAIVDHVSNTTYGTNVNVLFWGAVTASKQIDTGDSFQITAGNLDISLA